VKTRRCIFIDYGEDEFGYRFYDPVENKLVRRSLLEVVMYNSWKTRPSKTLIRWRRPHPKKIVISLIGNLKLGVRSPVWQLSPHSCEGEICWVLGSFPMWRKGSKLEKLMSHLT